MKLKHTFYCVNSRATPYHFRFSVSSDVFRDPSAYGRPPGVFNADCWGTTPQEGSHPHKPKVKHSEDPGTPARFPCATAFTSREQAALECDFWKLVLRKRYYLEIPWSHGTYEAFIEAANCAQRDVLAELADQSKWTHELLDFIDQHQSKLLQHRDAHKPELDLDEWEREAKRISCRSLFNWVQQVRYAQQELDSVPDVSRLESAANSLSSLRKYRPFECPRSFCLHSEFVNANNGLLSLAAFAAECDNLVMATEEKRRELKASLANLIKNRPAAIPDCEPGTELTYTSDGV